MGISTNSSHDEALRSPRTPDNKVSSAPSALDQAIQIHIHLTGTQPKLKGSESVHQVDSDSKEEDSQRRCKSKEFSIQGRVEDEPMFYALTDHLGLIEETTNKRDRRILKWILEEAASRGDSNDPDDILKFVKKALREMPRSSSNNLHRQLYRYWRMK